MKHHLYLSPGMFGFGCLGTFNYFAHVERELTARFAAAGHELVCHVVDVLPTASIRRRATKLAEMIAEADGDQPIHLLGHSTGGLDVRLAASPATGSIAADRLRWLPRLRSVTTMNTPHFGTPLASFFATAKGQHALAALSALTVVGLSLGAQPLAFASMLVGILHGSERLLPFRVQLLDRSVKSVVALVDGVRSPELRTFLAAIEDDAGSMIQLSPEAMDLMVASFDDRPGVVYQSTASMSPSPQPRRWMETIGHPWRAVSLSLFYALHRITAGTDDRYPCAAVRESAPWCGDRNEAFLAGAMTTAPPAGASDGVVPFRSQLWATVVWAGLGDHLDVLGHFLDHRPPSLTPPDDWHTDWLTSGSEFTDRDFSGLMDAVAGGMLAAG